ncbi:hypothetical protein FH609_012040 [Streptomyces sp. 3MP-14]|uniref:DUF6881 domain-containing protein n=1 Tax=Streptomyces mimosae TaxID=2586635 RepID=A0A5N6AHU1_9ACTN|nr:MULTISPECIES: hypothetical protein [Streptomyces]KAB8167118.1 hypothetical protein FH607_009490 [Streptomyces mimosae]KAB8177059.1 hypothetical protein FH609_012040 [Streptomyces sp. 3MP-14]
MTNFAPADSRDRRYWKVSWHHRFVEEPITLYSELGEDGCEVRRVEEFRDGTAGWADGRGHSARTFLAEVPFGDLAEVAAQEEFTPFLIGRREFEAVWERARRGAPRVG